MYGSQIIWLKIKSLGLTIAMAEECESYGREKWNTCQKTMNNLVEIWGINRFSGCDWCWCVLFVVQLHALMIRMFVLFSVAKSTVLETPLHQNKNAWFDKLSCVCLRVITWSRDGKGSCIDKQGCRHIWYAFLHISLGSHSGPSFSTFVAFFK